MVSAEPPPADGGSASDTGQELRGHFAYYGITGNSMVAAIPGRGGAYLEVMVVPPSSVWLSVLDGLQAAEAYLLPPATVVHSVCRPVSEHMT